MLNELKSAKRIIGFILIILVSIILLVKELAFNAKKKNTDDFAYKVIIAGGFIAFFIVLFTNV